MTPRLVTIGVSHYCEKARWALDRAGVVYREERHPPVLHILAVRRAGGRRTAPVLVTDEGALTDSSDILAWADRRPGAPRLYPDDAAARAAVEALETRFDEELGPHVRRFAYAHLLPDRALGRRLLTPGAPRLERALFSLATPAFTWAMRRAMRITPEGGERSRARVEGVLGEVEALLADGRPYLAGDAFGAADLTFAALVAPLVAPPEYGAPLPALDALPPALRGACEAYRARPAGAFALALYRRHRRAA